MCDGLIHQTFEGSLSCCLGPQVSKLRKYASMLDVLPSALEGKLHLVTYVNRSIAATFTAMSAHNSQWRWWVPWPPALSVPKAKGCSRMLHRNQGWGWLTHAAQHEVG